MDQNTKQLIDSLFERIQKAEKQGGSRDREAESLIETHVVHQPSAPYYMAQTMVMQEATIKQLHARVEALEQQLQQHQGGGFLSGLFGNKRSNGQTSGFQNQPPGGQSGYHQQSDGQQPNQRQQAYGQPQYGQPGGFGRGNSFLGGALQTAAGVAGGVVLGNLMMDMFSHHHPQEVVNIINEEPMQEMNPDMGNAADSSFADQGNFNDTQADQFADNSDFQQAPDNAGFDNTGFDNSGFDNSGFADNSDVFDNSGFGGDSDFGGFGGGGFDDFGGGFDDFT